MNSFDRTIFNFVDDVYHLLVDRSFSILSDGGRWDDEYLKGIIDEELKVHLAMLRHDIYSEKEISFLKDQFKPYKYDSFSIYDCASIGKRKIFRKFHDAICFYLYGGSDEDDFGIGRFAFDYL